MKFCEEWRPVSGYGGWYEVSSYGVVRSIDRLVNHSPSGLMTKPGVVIKQFHRDKSGLSHLCVDLCRNGHTQREYVHKIVLEAFCGHRPPGLECRHLDGDVTNNSVWNLEWSDRTTNQRDRVLHGTSNRGERSPHSILTSSDVLEICSIIDSGRCGSYSDIGRMYGVSKSTVSNIAKGRKWAWLTNRGRSTRGELLPPSVA